MLPLRCTIFNVSQLCALVPQNFNKKKSIICDPAHGIVKLEFVPHSRALKRWVYPPGGHSMGGHGDVDPRVFIRGACVCVR